MDSTANSFSSKQFDPLPQSNQKSITVKQELSNDSIQQIYLCFPFQNFDEKDLLTAINMITYGTLVTLYYEEQIGQFRLKQGVVYIIPDSSQVIWFYDKRSQQSFCIKFLNITCISSDNSLVPQGLLDQYGDNGAHFLVMKMQAGEVDTPSKYYAQFSTPKLCVLMHQAVQHYAIQDMYMMQFFNQISFMSIQLKHMLQKKDCSRVTPQIAQKLLKRLHYSLSMEIIENTMFELSHKRIAEDIEKDEFVSKFIYILKKSSAKSVFLRLTKKRGKDDQCTMTANEFYQFLVDDQMEKVDSDEVYQLITSIKLADQQMSETKTLSYINFSEYLFSKFNQINSPIAAEDHSQPITSYFVNTAYKVFNGQVDSEKFRILQKYNESNTGLNNLMHVLARGVKHIELEVWEDNNANPVVLGGQMQNVSLDLRVVLELLCRKAFAVSPMPLMLHIDDHCSPVGKTKLQTIINETLGEYLLLETQIQDEYLPSPKGLEFKIILTGVTRMQKKTKLFNYISKQLKFKSQKILQNDIDNSKIPDEEIDSKNKHFAYFQEGTQILSGRSVKNFVNHSMNDEICKSSGSSVGGSRYSNVSKAPSLNFSQRSSITGPATQCQIPILVVQGVQQQFTLFQVPLTAMDRIRDNKVIYETSDQVYLRLINQQKQLESKLNKRMEGDDQISAFDLVSVQSSGRNTQDKQLSLLSYISSLTNDFLIKQYPTDRNMGSQNMASQVMLSKLNILVQQALVLGVQMVCLQHHIIDFNYMYYYAIFRGEDGVLKGYILKPNNVKDSGSVMSSMLSSAENSQINFSLFNSTKTLHMHVISGHFLLNNVTGVNQSSESKLFVQVIVRTPVFGREEDMQMKTTNSIQSSSQTYHFESEFEFELPINDSFYTVIMFLVFADNHNNLVSWNSFKCNNLRYGYRTVPLMDEYLNNLNHSCLFVKSTLN